MAIVPELLRMKDSLLKFKSSFACFQNIKISNVVYMGIGEPLDNYENVVNSIRIINNPKGINIGARQS